MHVKTTGGIEQIQQHMAEWNFGQWFGKNRLEHRAQRRLKFFNFGVGRYPAWLHMQFSHFAVISVKEGQKIFSKIAFVLPIQCANDTAVDPDPLWVVRVLIGNKDIAGMHIGMKETVAKDLRKKHFNATLGL